MSVERKIKELLERVDTKNTLDETSHSTLPMGASGVGKDSTLKAANSGDGSAPKQGNSKDMSYETRDEKEGNQGAQVSKGIKKNDIQMKAPVGDAPNFSTTADLRTAVNQPNSKGNIHREETESDEEDIISEEEAEDADSVDIEASEDDEVISEEEVEEEDSVEEIDLSPIFGEDLSEEFKNKATAIFEAAVIARVNNAMETVAEALEEKYAQEVSEYKDSIVEKVDAYLSYVVENWMEENKLAVENGLRTEIAEDFITGLKALFKEHYIEVPEEKYDVIGELQSKVNDLEESLNAQLNNNVNLNTEVSDLKKKLIISEMSEDLADTEVKKLTKLLEGVDFENEEIYTEKVKVIKENYFPQERTKTPQKTLIEETESQESFETNSTISEYAKALSRSVKRT